MGDKLNCHEKINLAGIRNLTDVRGIHGQGIAFGKGKLLSSNSRLRKEMSYVEGFLESLRNQKAIAGTSRQGFLHLAKVMVGDWGQKTQQLSNEDPKILHVIIVVVYKVVISLLTVFWARIVLILFLQINSFYFL